MNRRRLNDRLVGMALGMVFANIIFVITWVLHH